MLVTIDTQIMIWGLRKTATQGQESMIERASRLLGWFDAQGHKLALTSQVVAEYFIGDIDDDTRASEMKTLTSRFLILPYDANAAMIAARIRSDKSFIKSLGESVGKTRACVKVDAVIVATAKANGVDRIYSDDSGVKALAGRCPLSVVGLPELAAYDPLPPTLPVKPTRGHQRSIFDSDPSAEEV